jgi:zinc protease
MIRKSAVILALMFAVVLPLPAQQAKPAAQKPVWEQQAPPLPAFHPQEPKRIELKNGMVIFLQEDHELPLIDGTMRIRGGGREVPASKAGMMSIYGEAWRTGGTKTKTGDDLDDFLEARAAKVETAGAVDSTSIGFSCLKPDFEDVFAVFLDVLRNPELRQDKIDLAKDQVNTSISRRNDQIGEIAGRESTKLAWGAENPYARQAEYATVAAITRQDLLDFHQKYLHPNNVILGVVGDFDPAQMEARLRKEFEDWPRGEQFKATPVEFQGAKPGLYFIPKEDVNQSAVRMMYPLDVVRRDPDYYPIEVMNEVLGGGFASRLIANVRSAKGLAYAVGGGISVPFDHPGLFRLAMGTKSQSTVEGAVALRDEMVGMVKNKATEVELKRAKDDILNAFIFNFDSKAKVLRERMAYEFYGYPADFLEQYRTGIEKVTAADVARVAEKYLHPERLAILVVGNDKEFDKPLNTLGAVTPIDITIPPPAGQERPAEAAAESAPTASNPEGKALAAKVAEGLGGAKVQSVKAYRLKGSLKSAAVGEIDFDRTEILPDSRYTAMQSGMGNLAVVVTPKAAFMTAGGESKDLTGAQREDIEDSIKRDPLNVAQHLNDPKYNFTANGTEKVGDVEGAVLDINADGAKARWVVDPKTGRILRTEFQRLTQGKWVHRIEVHSDFRTVDGVTVPFKSVLTEDGKDTGNTELTEFVVNPKVDPKLFERPASAAK